MSHVNVVRAWKDEAYRLSLTEAERARLPENPAGLLEQTEAELERATGGGVVLNTVRWIALTVDCPWPSLGGCSDHTVGVYGGDPIVR
jgi:mersacidin/lichenicidin family type 2 lantibiotic